MRRLCLVFVSLSPLSAQSPRDSTSVIISGTTHNTSLTINYGRPLALGERILGGSVPYDRVWASGKGTVARLSTDRPIELGGLHLDAGVYGLWTLPSRTGITLIVSRNISTEYEPSQDVGRVPLIVDSLPAQLAQFTIFLQVRRRGSDTLVAQYNPPNQKVTRAGTTLVPAANTVSLIMEWERWRWTVPIKVL